MTKPVTWPMRWAASILTSSPTPRPRPTGAATILPRAILTQMAGEPHAVPDWIVVGAGTAARPRPSGGIAGIAGCPPGCASPMSSIAPFMRAIAIGTRPHAAPILHGSKA